jgi:hypothetical protein
MAELTNLETKLGEVTGLAMAAKEATTKVMTLAKGEKELVAELRRMKAEASETEQRCKQLAGSFTGKKSAILEEAKDVKEKGATMLKTYLDADSDALDGFEFLTMAEAGEVGHWSVLQQLSRKAGNRDVSSLVSWALPIQQRHFKTVSEASKGLAAEEDPNEAA